MNLIHLAGGPFFGTSMGCQPHSKNPHVIPITMTTPNTFDYSPSPKKIGRESLGRKTDVGLVQATIMVINFIEAFLYLSVPI
jgi:hypothetical protein